MQKKYGPEPKEEEEQVKQEPKEKEKEKEKEKDTQLAALRARLARFYKKYNPDQVDRVNDIAIKYRDREDDLFKALIEKYGPEGEVEEEQQQEEEEQQQQQQEKPQDTELEARLRRFYNKYNPDQNSRVSEIAAKYKDRVDALFEALVKKYGPEPEVVMPTPKKARLPTPKQKESAIDRIKAMGGKKNDFPHQHRRIVQSIESKQWVVRR